MVTKPRRLPLSFSISSMIWRFGPAWPAKARITRIELILRDLERPIPE